MHPDKWPDIKEKILENFEVLKKEKIKDEERKENFEIIEFIGPLGKMKVEWITRPKVLDKKTQYSNRIGSSVSVETVYSEDEVTNTFKVYKWDDNSESWQEMKAEGFI